MTEVQMTAGVTPGDQFETVTPTMKYSFGSRAAGMCK